MSAQHTPGRLHVKNATIRAEGPGIDCVAVMQVSNQPLWNEDARRLVACWNACDGLSTGNLEVLPGYKSAIEGFHEQRSLVVQARSQRDALLAAAQWAIDNPGAHPENVRSVMRDAIAKATGQEGGAQ